MLKQQKNNKILLLLSVCIMLTMLLQVAYAADHTINITQQPASSLTGVTGESPGTISVEATTTNGAPITYQWWCILESGTSHTVGTDANTFKISSDLVPGTYEYYCDLKAEGCDAIESEKTTVTVNKATYTGIQSDTFYVKADQSTLNNEYILPNVPMSDMTYTIEDNGGNLVTGTGELKRDASTDWRWILIFNTASKPAGTEEDIILKINGGYCYNDSSFTLTVKAGKLPVSITGIDGTDAEYSGNPQKGYTGEPQTGGFTGALNHHYNGRNTTVYDSGTAPTDAGDYTVTLSIPEDADYSGSKTIDFSIKKKEVKVWLVNYVMVQGEELPTSDSIYVNYIGFVAGDNSNNSISTWAVPKLNVSDSNTPGVSDIDFKTEATLVTEKEKNYTLKHEKSELTIQAKTYCVIVEGSYAPTSGVGDYYSNDTVNIDAGTRDGYTFVNWTSPDGVSFANPGSASTTFIMPGKDVTVTANWTYNSGGGGGGGSSSNTNATLSDSKVEFDKNEGDDLKVTLKSGSYNLRSIKNGSYTLREGKDYTISGRIVTIKASYLDSLEEGKHSLTFDMNGGTDPVMTIIVKDTTETDPQEEKLHVEETVNFEDVKSSDWFYDAVNYVYNAGLMKGNNDTTSSSYADTTRGMIVTILHRLEGSPKANTANDFTDVGLDKYFTDAVAWASENKIVSGYGNGIFGYENSITREQLAVILMNYAKYKGYDVSMRSDLSEFADGEHISPWAKDAMSWANAVGLIQGSQNQLMPTGNAQRSQVAAILQRFIETIAK